MRVNKKILPSGLFVVLSILTQQLPLTQRQFSLDHNTQVHYNVLINMIKSRLTLDALPMIEEYMAHAKIKLADKFTDDIENDLLFIIEKISETITWEQIVYLEKLNQLANESKLLEEEVFFYDEIYLNGAYGYVTFIWRIVSKSKTGLC